MKKIAFLLCICALLLAGCGTAAPESTQPVNPEPEVPSHVEQAGEAAVPQEGDIVIPIG